MSFVSSLGFISVVGDPDYDVGDLDRCIGDYEVVLENADGVSDIEELRDEGGEEDDRVWAVFVYEWEDDDGDTATYIRSISCEALEGGLTLVVMHDALEEHFEALRDEGEALLAGFEAA